MRLRQWLPAGVLIPLLMTPVACAEDARERVDGPAAITTGPARTEAQTNPWDALVGDWRGTGQVNGMAAKLHLQFKTTLDGRGRRLSFENQMTAADGKVWRFLAEALYLCDLDGHCRGQWQDSRGMLLPLQTHSEPDRVIVNWGDDSSERGRTTYRIEPDGALHITDEVLKPDGVWVPFGRSRAERKASSRP